MDSDGSPNPAEGTDSGTPTIEPQDFSVRAPLAEASVQNVLRDLPHRLAPGLRLTLSSGLSRLSQLRGQPNGNTRNASHHNIRALFSDTTAQHIAQNGLARLANNAAEDGLDAILPDNLAIWSQGQIAVGSLKSAAGQKLDIEIADLALGIDKRVTPQLTLGGYVQALHDDGGTALYDNGLTIGNVLGYASYVTDENRFAQIALGGGGGKIEMNRNTSDTLYGARSDAKQIHALLSLGQQWSLAKGQLAVAMDLAAQQTRLDGYEEVGEDGAYGYRDRTITHRFVGLTGEWVNRHAISAGTAQSFVKFGYQADVSRAGTAYAYALDDHTTLYHFKPEDTDKLSLSHATLAVGGDIETLDGWRLQAGLAFDAYEVGTIGRLTLSAGRQF